MPNVRAQYYFQIIILVCTVQPAFNSLNWQMCTMLLFSINFLKYLHYYWLDWEMIKRWRIFILKEKGERTKHEHLPATHHIILEYIITFIQQLTVEGSATFFFHSVYFPEPSLLSVQFFKQIARTQPLTKVNLEPCTVLHVTLGIGAL